MDNYNWIDLLVLHHKWSQLSINSACTIVLLCEMCCCCIQSVSSLQDCHHVILKPINGKVGFCVGVGVVNIC